ncbi:Centractin [Balamuthia mandrillaris]
MSSASGYVMLGGHCASDVVGNAAQQHRGILSLDYPVKRGLIQNWESFEKLLEHCILYLHILPRDEPLTFCHSPYHPPASNNRLCEVVFEKFGTTALKLGTHVSLLPEQEELPLALSILASNDRLCELLFEKFDAQNLKLGTHAELAALACGHEICLIVDFGAGRTTVTPCYYGYLLNSAARNVHFGGFDLVTYLHRLIIAETGYYLSTSSEFDILRDIQKTVCYVSERRPIIAGNDTLGPSWSDASTTETFILPDGQTLTLSDALRQSSEAIFNPSLLGREIETCPSLASIILKTVKACPVDCRAQLLKNIVLVGCPTKLKGFKTRLHEELVQESSGEVRFLSSILDQTQTTRTHLERIPYELLEQVHCKIRHRYEARINIVEDPAVQQHAAWLGGSIAASLCDFSQQSGISKREEAQEEEADIFSGLESRYADKPLLREFLLHISAVADGLATLPKRELADKLTSIAKVLEEEEEKFQLYHQDPIHDSPNVRYHAASVSAIALLADVFYDSQLPNIITDRLLFDEDELVRVASARAFLAAGANTLADLPLDLEA